MRSVAQNKSADKRCKFCSVCQFLLCSRICVRRLAETVLIVWVALVASLAVGVELPAVATKYKFEQFPVPLEKVVKPASPRLDSPEARRYATQLRRGAKAGPNYCGRLSVVEWGCGSCCVEFAVIDLRSGEVFLPGFSVVCATSPLDDPIWASAALYYRADSSLLVVVGAPNEGPERGVYYWRWNGHALVMLGSDHVVKVEE